MVKNAISPSQVARLNAILDQKISEGRWHIADRQHQPADAEQAGANKPGQARPQAGLTQPINCRFGSQARVGELLDWGADLTDLIDQPTVLPILHELCGQGCRLDHVRQRTPSPPRLRYGGAALALSLVGWRAQDYINVLQTGEEDDGESASSTPPVLTTLRCRQVGRRSACTAEDSRATAAAAVASAAAALSSTTRTASSSTVC